MAQHSNGGARLVARPSAEAPSAVAAADLGSSDAVPHVEAARPWEALQLLEDEVAGSRAEAVALQERVSALERELAAARAEGPASAAAEAASERAALRHRAGELDEQVADLRAEVNGYRHPGSSRAVPPCPSLYQAEVHIMPQIACVWAEILIDMNARGSEGACL